MNIIITTIIITVVIVRGEKTLKKTPRPAFFLVSRTFPQCFFFFLNGDIPCYSHGSRFTDPFKNMMSKLHAQQHPQLFGADGC